MWNFHLLYIYLYRKGDVSMGKDLKGKELGKGIRQRKDGKYSGRFEDRFGRRREVYGLNCTPCQGHFELV